MCSLLSHADNGKSEHKKPSQRRAERTVRKTIRINVRSLPVNAWNGIRDGLFRCAKARKRAYSSANVRSQIHRNLDIREMINDSSEYSNMRVHGYVCKCNYSRCSAFALASVSEVNEEKGSDKYVTIDEIQFMIINDIYSRRTRMIDAHD